MRKIALIVITLFAVTIVAFAQDQIVNGSLHVGQNNSTYGEGNRLYFRGTASSNDPVWMAKYTPQQEVTDLRINVGDAKISEDRLVVGTTQWDTGYFHEWFIVRMDGNVGIGVAQPTSKLDVNGKIKGTALDIAGTINTRQVNITVNAGADHVFYPAYNLMPLSEVETFVKENKHLPEIPSEKQMIEEGVNVNEMQIKLLQKIEELTLYVIEQDKRIRTLEEENRKLKED